MKERKRKKDVNKQTLTVSGRSNNQRTRGKVNIIRKTCGSDCLCSFLVKFIIIILIATHTPPKISSKAWNHTEKDIYDDPS